MKGSRKKSKKRRDQGSQPLSFRETCTFFDAEQHYCPTHPGNDQPARPTPPVETKAATPPPPSPRAQSPEKPPSPQEDFIDWIDGAAEERVYSENEDAAADVLEECASDPILPIIPVIPDTEEQDDVPEAQGGWSQEETDLLLGPEKISATQSPRRSQATSALQFRSPAAKRPAMDRQQQPGSASKRRRDRPALDLVKEQPPPPPPAAKSPRSPLLASRAAVPLPESLSLVNIALGRKEADDNNIEHGALPQAPAAAAAACLDDAVTAAQLVKAQGIDLPEPNHFALRPLPPPEVVVAPPLHATAAVPLQVQQGTAAMDPSQVSSLGLGGAAADRPWQQHPEFSPPNEVQAVSQPAGAVAAAAAAAAVGDTPGVRNAGDLLSRLVSPVSGNAATGNISNRMKTPLTNITGGGGGAAASNGPKVTRALQLASPERPASNVRSSRPASDVSPAPTTLTSYLPDYLCDAVRSRGDVQGDIYQWQADCLMADNSAVLNGTRNLVFTAPTSGGKTLVAEILMLRALGLDRGRKAMLVLPYVALCREMAKRLAPLLVPLEKEVKELHGGSYSTSVLGPTTGIIVCTIENANLLINKLLETGSAIHEELSCVVIDELHLIGDAERGYQLELLLTKLRYHAATQVVKAAAEVAAAVTAPTVSPHNSTREGATNISSPSKVPSGGPARPNNNNNNNVPTPLATNGHTTTTTGSQATKTVQIVGMSATIPNLPELADWLGAAMYTSDYRPVVLQQYLKAGDELIAAPQDGNPEGALVPARTLPPPTASDPDHITFLTGEVVMEGHSVIIFCASKRWCVLEAKRLANALTVPDRTTIAAAAAAARAETSPVGGFTDASADEFSRESIAAELEGQQTAHSSELAMMVRRGIAYHNRDLTKRERELIETAYRRGNLCVLCATSTLAAGVNLPARRVIFKHAYVAQPTPPNFLNATRYRQMAGRAGRAGIDDYGESILIFSHSGGVPLPYLQKLLRSQPDDIDSCLEEGRHGLKRAMLEIVASGAAKTPADINRYVKCTLLAASKRISSPQAANDAAIAALSWLATPAKQAESGVVDGEALIQWDKVEQVFKPLRAGKAVLGSGLSPEDAFTIKADLARARKSFVMTSDLHPCYLCVPFHTSSELYMGHNDWGRLHNIIISIEAEGGADQNAMLCIGVNPGYVLNRSRGAHAKKSGDEQDRLCRRFYAACILRDLIQEMPVDDCKNRYGLSSTSMVEGLQESASRFAYKGRMFCERMGWGDMAAVLDRFGARIGVGARSEILSLTMINGVKAPTARLLYNAGLEQLQDVARADLKTVERALTKGPPAKNKTAQEARAMLRSKARDIQEAAQKLMLKMAEEIIQGATNNKDGEGGSHAGGQGRGRGRGQGRGGQRGGQGNRPLPPLPPTRQQQQLQEENDAQVAAALEVIEEEHGHEEEWEAFEEYEAAAVPKVVPVPVPEAVPDAVPVLPSVPVPPLVPAPVPPPAAAPVPVPIPVEAVVQDKGKGKAPVSPSPPSLPDAPAGQGNAPAAAVVAPAGPPYGGVAGMHFITALPELRELIDSLRSYKQISIDFNIARCTLNDDLDSAGLQKVPAPPKRGAKRKASEAEDAALGAAKQQKPGVSFNKMPPAGTVLGLALSWAPGCAAYIPLYPSSSSRSYFVAGATTKLAEFLSSPESSFDIIAFGWKPQVLAARWLLSHSPGGSGAGTGAGAGAGAHRGAYNDPLSRVTDARIAAWMVHPGASFVSDGRMSERTASMPWQSKAKKATTQAAPINAYQLLLQFSGSAKYADAAIKGLQQPPPGVDQGAVGACRTAAAALQVGKLAIAKIKELGMLDALQKTEMALVPVLADMEAAGVGVQLNLLKQLNTRLNRRIAEVEKAAHRVAGSSFDLKSASQVIDLLFRKLALVPPPCADKPAKNKDGTTYMRKSADKDVLAALIKVDAHPVVNLIQEHRKLCDTVEKGIAALVASARRGTPASRNGVVRVHGCFMQTNTDTGRLAVEDPPLQCVPKTHGFVVLPSQRPGAGSEVDGLHIEEGEPVALTPAGKHQHRDANVRSAIVPASAGRVILSADFRQIELRMMAHFSGDSVVRAQLADGAADPFVQLAATWRHVDPSEVTDEHRNRTKAILYGLFYGMGPGRMAESLGVTANKAAKLRDEFLSTFSGVADWLKSVVEQCRIDGYITTLHGRRRWLPNITSDNNDACAAAERAAVNSVCQGSAADVAKAAMIAIHRRLSPSGAEKEGLPPGCAHIIHQIHDELLLEVETEHIDKVARIVRECMEGAAVLDVPLRAKIRVGPSWGELEDILE